MTTDRGIITIVVATLAAAVLVGVGIEGWLASTQTPVPDQFDRLIFLLAGGLIAMLSKTTSSPSAGDAPQPVVVQQPDNDPIPVEDA